MHRHSMTAHLHAFGDSLEDMARRIRIQHAGALLLWLCLTGCEPAPYAGDGKLTDNGLFAATDRYVLDLGQIALKDKGERTYKIERLPKKKFVVGIEIRPAVKNAEQLEKKPINAVVSLSLVTAQGKTIFAGESNLTAWTWSVPSTGEYAFLYREVDTGTFFNADPDTRYVLKVSVNAPDNGTLKYETALLARSGGWK